ncbi:unnamed protein product [Acanthoscelides obtectus]|uniref:PiggyBac transposable element-derived protein domain-containing protein n=1 Tax=Acanthoscelides obtectus TaxID=200917 RepID=A0A9P0L9D3_ACAOB|nr:unnamed protein product [Acanthoscelides obtectus]CAK1671061.1 hypothetical protein AOBTE_LOCUS28027 [Acanthoscelides obtectus]
MPGCDSPNHDKLYKNGYVCQFQMEGKTNNQPEQDLGQRVILDLTRDLIAKGYHVFFDNFLTLCHYRKHCKQNVFMYAALSRLT